MEDNTPTPAANPAPTTPPEENTDEFSVPVKVATSPASKPMGPPNVPLETVEPPTDNGGLPPAEPELDSAAAAEEIPPAPLQTPAMTSPGDAKSPSGKTLQELLAEEEAKNPAPDLSGMNGHKKRGMGVKILIIVLLLAALGGGAGYAYLQTNKKVQPAATPVTETPAKTEDTAVKAADIDKTSSDLDASLKKVDDTKDYSATDLSDTTLGL